MDHPSAEVESPSGLTTLRSTDDYIWPGMLSSFSNITPDEFDDLQAAALELN